MPAWVADACLRDNYLPVWWMRGVGIEVLKERSLERFGHELKESLPSDVDAH